MLKLSSGLDLDTINYLIIIILIFFYRIEFFFVVFNFFKFIVIHFIT